MLAYLSSRTPPDVVLMDIVLRGMDGIEGASHVKAIAPSVDVVILTNYADDEKVFEALCSGASGYVLKTSSSNEITEAVQQVMDGGAPMTPQIARKVLAMFSRLKTPAGDYSLTDRETAILKLLVEGDTAKMIAGKLFVSYLTVRTHLKNIYSKLHVHSRGGAVAKVLRENLI
jgi:DNA-binding NarL/FixJ family response regulator